MNEKIYQSYCYEETKKIGFEIGKNLKAGDVVAIDGELGSGKTALICGIAKALCYFKSVTSPTFTIINEYEGTLPIYHFDVYRLTNNSDIEGLGFDEYIYGEGVTIIEWAQNINNYLPKKYLQINIEKNYEIDENYRKITLKRVGMA